MPTGESLSLQSAEKTLALSVRYCPVRKSNCVLSLKELSTGEGCVVPDFERAEELLPHNLSDGTGALADQLSCKRGRYTSRTGRKKKGLDRLILLASRGRCSEITTSSSKWIATSAMFPGICPAWYTAAGLSPRN